MEAGDDSQPCEKLVMADPLVCLRNTTIGIAIWSIIYALIQMGLLGWQTKVVRDIQWEYEGRQLPATGGIDAFQARFPGLYAIYTETPERRRINALFVIVLVALFLSFVHFFMSIALLYGAIKYNKNFVWPWIFSAAPIIIMSTAYAVLWWSGDVFNEQLTMSVAEFIMSLAVNGICLVIVIFFYWRLIGRLTSDKPAHSRSGSRTRARPSSRPPSRSFGAPVQTTYYRRTPLERCSSPPRNLPPWREEWPAIPDPPLQKKIRRRDRRSTSDPRVMSIPRKDDGSLDFFAPEPYDPKFPWKVDKLERERRKEERRPHTAAEAIERLYYSNYPDDLPDIPHGMRSSLRKDRKRGRSPDRVVFSRADPEVVYRTPQDSAKNSVV
nr:Protein ZK1010.8 [Haemonchus contortus]